MLALATLLNFYSLLLLVWWLQGTLRSCPRAKVESPVVAIEQVHFFLNYYISMTFCNFWPLNIFKPPKQCCRLSGNK